ncbi:MAG TPA: AsmA family protein [Gammaproteobacteria bacterium]|nr:AsmA family protein [Gammaproteobacteria bacterium]
MAIALKILKWTGIALGVLIVLIVLLLAFFPWNWLRGPINQIVSDRLHREFAINGDLHANLLSLTPYISIENVELANASWSRPPKNMLSIQKAEFRISLPALLHGDIVIPEIALSHPNIDLEINADGQRNWVFNPREAKRPQPPPIPEIHLLTINQGSIRFQDAPHKTDVTLHLSAFAPGSPEHQGYGMKFDANGTYKGVDFDADGHGGPVLSLQDPKRPYPLELTMSAGKTRGTIRGTITNLTKPRAMDVDFKLSVHGQDLSVLYPLLHVTLPPTPPYRVTGHLQRHGDTWTFKDFEGHIGSSDVEGGVAFTRTGPRPMLRGHLKSTLLDLKDLGGLVGAQPNAAPAESHAHAMRQMENKERASGDNVLPNTPFHLKRLRTMDADIWFNGKEIRGRKWPLNDLKLHITLDDGLLTLDPVDFGVAGGQVIATVVLNARGQPIQARAQLELQHLQLATVAPSIALMEGSEGVFGGRAHLSGKGNSVATLLGTMNGHVAFVLTNGRINQELVELAGIDASQFLGLLVSGGDIIPIRCGVGDFVVNDGLMKIKVLVFDTTDTNIHAGGMINFANEALRVTIRPIPKDFSIGSARGPITIAGTLGSPSISPSGETIGRAAAAALLGLAAGPLAALIPLIETGPGHNANCQALIQQARRDASKAPMQQP